MKAIAKEPVPHLSSREKWKLWAMADKMGMEAELTKPGWTLLYCPVLKAICMSIIDAVTPMECSLIAVVLNQESEWALFLKWLRNL